MDQPKRRQIARLTAGLGLGLLAMGALRLAAMRADELAPLSGFATAGYVVVTVFFAIRLMRAGLPLHRLGFGVPLGLRQILSALAAVAVLQFFAFAIEPLTEQLLGGARNLERFAGIRESPESLAALLLMSWTLAAFGEELAYRIVLMRGISFALGDSQKAQVAALAAQAVMFGLVHAYQGPTGVLGSTFSGLVFGAATLAGRRSIWPAALAHGANNTLGILELYFG